MNRPEFFIIEYLLHGEPKTFIIRMRPGITSCVIKPAANYVEAAARFHSPAASAGA
jgi:hypothetical protein